MSEIQRWTVNEVRILRMQFPAFFFFSLLHFLLFFVGLFSVFLFGRGFVLVGCRSDMIDPSAEPLTKRRKKRETKGKKKYLPNQKITYHTVS
jgi:hypothetical protein